MQITITTRTKTWFLTDGNEVYQSTGYSFGEEQSWWRFPSHNLDLRTRGGGESQESRHWALFETKEEALANLRQRLRNQIKERLDKLRAIKQNSYQIKSK